MLPITEKHSLPNRSLDALVFADDRLKAVCEGKSYLLFDGAMGTMLQSSGLKAGELPELLCFTHPDEVTAIHAQYVAAGSDVITTNTFGANARKLGGAATVADVFTAAVTCARESGASYVAADLGPTGALLEPMGTLSFDEAYRLFAEQVIAAEAAGADIILIETMADLLEMKAAVLAAKENSHLPIFATMTFGEDGRTFLGTSPQVAAMTLSSLGVNVLGVNCSLGPNDLIPIVMDLLTYSECPVMVQANAGLPKIENGKTVFTITSQEYAASVDVMLEAGVSVIGGCCGTNPDYVREMAALIQERQTPAHREEPVRGGCTSGSTALVLGQGHVAVIGERINPTGKKRLKEALRKGEYDYILSEALDQMEAGADILDVNVGLPDIDEAAVLTHLVGALQSVTPAPLQIDSANPGALEAAVRVYAGKPIINSVNGSEESMAAVLPIVAHYGCAVVALTLDEAGLPKTAQGRFDIAKKIMDRAAEYGIPAENIHVDCLALAVSADQNQARETLEAIRRVTRELHLHTTLGVSNISFGLPTRPLVNTTFLAAAFNAGLDMPIIDPTVARNRETVDAWRVLCVQDEGATTYIDHYANATVSSVTTTVSAGTAPGTAMSTPADAGVIGRGLFDMVVSGRKGEVADEVERLLKTVDAMDVINNELIPALDEVGNRFEKGTFFLPQLMASAEAARAGFDVIRSQVNLDQTEKKEKVAIATVKGDIHDIGKNIVKMLLENYGYDVYDLGRDVDPEVVVDFVVANDIKVLGLSALMTTTVDAMRDTITLLRSKTEGVTVMVGGAVLTPEYAEMVGADYYAKDAAESARIVAEVFA